VAADMIEDIELETEWPGRTVEAESLETIDSGRGMNSKSSEKPTRVFLATFGSAVSELATGSVSGLVGCMAESRDTGNGELWCSESAEGEFGALLPLTVPGFGFKIMLRSETDMAADRLCACPRRPFGGPRAACGNGNALSLFVGLVDNNSPLPVWPSPPANSDTFL
jgi:hypothetical protein